jgi:hypothetical protein
MFGLLLSLLFAADAEVPSARWEFRDSATHAGRSIVTFRPVELTDKPVRPLHPDDRPPGKARYGVLPIGNRTDAQPSIIWIPDAPGGQEVWIDADGDGRFQPAERHRFDRPSLEVQLPVTIARGDKLTTHQRTILIRRKISDDGLSYAVRGYVAGRLELNGQVYDALLTDHNADGCFDKADADRIWIDLSRDGVFDALTEQFPLGTPLTVGARTYLIRPSADGNTVTVRDRPTERGTLRLELGSKSAIQPAQFAAQLVSEWGELVTVNHVGEPVSVPIGRYAIEAVTCQLTDTQGRIWSYHFAGEPRFSLFVESKREATLDLFRGLTLRIRHTVPPEGVAPGQEFQVTPDLRTPEGLELVNAEFVDRNNGDPTSVSADIQLLASDGSVVDRISSGFL